MGNKPSKPANDDVIILRRTKTGRFFNATPDTGKRSSQPKVGPNPLPPRPTPPAATGTSKE